MVKPSADVLASDDAGRLGESRFSGCNVRPHSNEGDFDQPIRESSNRNDKEDETQGRRRTQG